MSPEDYMWNWMGWMELEISRQGFANSAFGANNKVIPIQALKCPSLFLQLWYLTINVHR